jgi:hypothetical protein
MTFTDGGTNEPFVFAGASAEAGVVTTGFDLGTTNTLELIVNNTQLGIYGTPTGLGYTEAGVSGTVTYSTSGGLTPTPEPRSWYLVAGVFVAMAALARRWRSVYPSAR